MKGIKYKIPGLIVFALIGGIPIFISLNYIICQKGHANNLIADGYQCKREKSKENYRRSIYRCSKGNEIVIIK